MEVDDVTAQYRIIHIHGMSCVCICVSACKMVATDSCDLFSCTTLYANARLNDG